LAFIFPTRDNAIAEYYDRLRINIPVSQPDFASGIGVRVREFKLHSGFPFCRFNRLAFSYLKIQPNDVRADRRFSPLCARNDIFRIGQ